TYAPRMTIDSGAKLLTDAINANGTTFKSGDITLKTSASEISLNVPILANFGTDYTTSSIDVSGGATINGANVPGATIKGGKVTIDAKAGDVNPLKTLAQNIGGTAGGVVSGLLGYITGLATDYLSLPISVQLKSPNSEVTVGNGASITS